jgi:hypothetical protein
MKKREMMMTVLLLSRKMRRERITLVSPPRRVMMSPSSMTSADYWKISRIAIRETPCRELVMMCL